MHKPDVNMPHQSEIFDRRLRRLRRDRAAPQFQAHGFLYRHMAEELLDRLKDVKREFKQVLLIGTPDQYLRRQLADAGMSVISTDPALANCQGPYNVVQADEDSLPFADASFDLVIACGTLDSVNDLPGALILIRRILRPDGLFLGALFGAGTLSVLRSVLFAAEGERPAQHIHPQIEVRSAGDLLSRAGFAMPVADGDSLAVRYSGLFSLFADLRGMGASNVLSSRPPSMGRQVMLRAAQAFEAAADPDGKTAEHFSIIYLSGWAPHPDQPKAARRGSAKASLANALKSKI